MTTEEKEKAIRWLTEEVRMLRLAPTVNGCKPDNWAEQLEVMETCLAAVRDHFPDAKKMMPLTIEQLREMGGQPVLYKRANKWFIAELHHPDFGECIIDQTGYFIPLKTAAERGMYAYPPAHIDMEAWVSVEEQLPDKQKDVLMLFDSGNMAVGFWHDEDEHITFWCAYTDDGFYTDCDCMPTHWMTLPETPEEVEKRLRG